MTKMTAEPMSRHISATFVIYLKQNNCDPSHLRYFKYSDAGRTPDCGKKIDVFFKEITINAVFLTC